MAQQITPLSPSLPATTGIQDPAARQFAAAVSDILRTAQSPGYALSQLTRATAEMSGGNTPAAVQQWLVSTELYNKLTQAIQRVDTEATQAVAQERQERIAAIVAEGQARADEIAQEVLDRIAAVQAEETARALAVQAVVDDLEQEIIDRAAAVQAESAARMQALLNEAADRGTAISQEATERQSADDAIAQSVTNLSASVGGSISAIQDTLTALAGADSAEATARQTLAAQLRGTYEGGDLGAVPSGLLYQERVARVSGDETVAQSVTSLQTSVGNSLATLGDEIETVSTAVSSEASARQTLASQMRGTYEGGDLSAITSGLLYQERTARTAADQGLAQQITLLSAGAGEQFDHKKIWYFDSGNEGWTGNGTPTVSGGWLRPANATDPYLVSPTGIASDGAQYTQVRLRIRKTGTPTWAGELWWRTAADSTWDSARKTTISEPTYDGNGIGLATINPPWSGVIDRVRVDLSTVQDAGNGYDVDWVAVGRPSPGASSAALLEESLARTSAIDAEAASRRALSTKLTGLQDPASATLATLSSGLLYDERQARSSADSTEVTARQNLAVKLTGLADPTSATLATLSSGLIYDERTARASQDGLLATSISTLSGRVDDAEADIVEEASLRVMGDNAQATARQALSTKLTGLQDPSSATLATLTSGLIYDERQARSSADATEVTARQNLAVKLVGMTDPSGATLATLSSGLIYDERTARVAQDGVLASSISTLSGRVGDAEADIVEEASLRVTGDQANANAISGLSGRIGDAEAAITTETGLRVNADLALTQSISTQAGRIDNANTAITAEATTRTNNDLAIVSAVNTALAQITGVSTSISQSGQNLIANWTTAQADKWSQIESEVLTSGGQTIRAALQQEAATRANADGSLGAQWTLKTDINGYISGFGFASTANNATPTSEFIIRADKFAMVMPGYGEYVPFAIGDFGPAMFGDGGFSVPVSRLVNQAAQPTSFLETFESGSVAQWVNQTGLGELSVVSASDSLTGGKVLRIGNNSGNDQAWLIHKQNIPFDPSALYRIKFRVRRTAGTGKVYLGLAGVAADGVTWVNTSGANSPDYQHYVAAVAQSPGSAWTEYVGYVKGAAVTGQSGTNPPVTAPLKLHQNVKYIRPLILVNYPNAAGTTEVDYCSIELMADAMSWDGVSGSGKDALVTTASTALTNANAAQQDADAANAALADIAADNKLTPAEKQAIRKEWDTIYAERAGIRAQADSFGITTEKTNYDNDFQALGTYLNGGTAYTIGATPPSWITDANLATTTTIVGATFRANWSNLYADRQTLLNKISAEAAKRADWENVTGDDKPENGATKNRIFTQATAPTGAANGDIWIDTSVTPPVQKMMVGGSWQLAATVGANDSNFTGARGANLLRNTMLDSSTAGWATGVNGGRTLSAFNFRKDAYGAPVGYGALVFSTSGPVAAGFDDQLYSFDQRVPCTAGERIELQAWVQVFRGDVKLTCSFLLADGNYSLYHEVTGGVSTALSFADAAWSDDLADFAHLRGFVTAPANAVACYMELTIKRTTTVGITDLYVSRPYLGKAGAVQSTFSAWTRGVFIDQSSIKTWIANAAIGNAEIDRASVNKLQVVTADIQDLAVDTLKIAGNAVTIPVTASGGYNNGDGFQNWKIVCTVPITLDFPAFVYAHAVLSQSFPYGDRTWGAFISISGQGGMTVGGQRLSDSASLAATRYLSAGSHTITLYWSSDSGGDVISSSIFALAVKR